MLVRLKVGNQKTRFSLLDEFDRAINQTGQATLIYTSMSAIKQAGPGVCIYDNALGRNE